jgi:transposase
MAAPLFARPPRGAEERKIRMLAGARHATADWVLRARMINAFWGEKNVSTIAAELGCNPKTVRVRLHRFNAEGLDGLGDQPIPRRPPRLSEADRSRLTALVKQPPIGPASSHRSR